LATDIQANCSIKTLINLVLLYMFSHI